MECEKRERIWGGYNKRLNAFTNAAGDLQELAGSIEFHDKLLALQCTKDQCSQARKTHLTAHQCDHER